MLKQIGILLALSAFIGCASKKRNATSALPGSGGDTRTVEVAYLSSNAYLITETTTDKTYGYTAGNPIMVGGMKESSGPMNERRYLNGLLGPNGEEIEYYRRGSCCAFKTPNGMLNDMGLLDTYKVYWKGCTDTLTLFLNMYDKGNLKIPVGLTAKKP
ncbi:MAG TPA: hypothetical protein PKD90_05965 [Phnomibacter sp.]|nr:hypothetical protein [Phnomibacter sp.]